MRIFIGLTEVAGTYGNLANGFRDLGIHATFVNLNEHPFQYAHGEVPSTFEKWLKYLANKRTSAPRSRVIPWAWWKGVQLLTQLLFFAHACIRYDVFIFGFTSSFFSFRDLPILKLLRKKIVYVFNGSDSRPSYLNGAEMFPLGTLSIRQCIDRTRRKKEIVRTIERYADAIVCDPLSSHLHERTFVPYTLMGRPCPSRIVSCAIDEPDARPIRILHAPSHPEAKGTFRIRQMIERLRAKGHAIELIEITSKPNRVVLDELAKCDVVVDQLYSDVPMSRFPAEAAGFGKPAVVGSYGIAALKAIFPNDRFPPVCFRHPDDVEAGIEKLIVDKAYRVELGKRAKRFVDTHWNQRNVAERFLQLIRGDIPIDWFYDPSQVRYVHGMCLPEKTAKDLVRAVVEEGGQEALQVRDKPELERLLIEFSGIETN
jgi:glycosyltransferase involved in cell wall biosynthesis